MTCFSRTMFRPTMFSSKMSSPTISRRTIFRLSFGELDVYALAATFALGGCSKPAPEANVKTESKRQAAPKFSLKDENGAAVNLADYKGKVVLLNFWATWC